MSKDHHRFSYWPIAVLLTIAYIIVGCAGEHRRTDSTNESIASFELPDGFKIELIASEPLLGDPVDMEIDENGRLYVVEMPGYPLDKTGTGTVKILSDEDGDGTMDRSVVFAENLVLPNSIMRWKNGVLVTDAPYVLYFEDSNNDGKSDVRDTVLTGFALSNPQHNLNSPLLGIDNWIYLGHEGAVSTDTYEKEFGDAGTEIYFPKHPASPRLGVNANGRAVRFNPEKHLLEETSGHTQFGHTFDEWGHHFLVGNANHIYQEVIAESYLHRNRDLLISEATESISDHGEACEVFPITENPEHQLLTDVGVITSACGLTAYTGGTFAEPYNQNVTFVAEPVSNLVHVDKLTPKGAAFKASRVLEHSEFLASRDARFRPVNLYVGPDGALYVVDYYRQIIEHPEWMSDDVIKSGELYNDADKGRIYRISPAGSGKPEWTTGLTLGKASSQELVQHLSHANAWWRMNAQRLLIDRKDPASLKILEEAVGNASSPFGRLHALWTLQGLDALKPPLIVHALQDKDPGVRENAVKLAELQLAKFPELETTLYSMASDADSKVRFQLLCTTGSIDTKEALQIRKKILFHDIDDPWVQVAALTGSLKSAPDLFREVLTMAGKEPDRFRSLTGRLSAVISAGRDSKQIALLVEEGTKAVTNVSPSIQASILEGLVTALDASKSNSAMITSAAKASLLRNVLEHPSEEVRRAALGVLKLTEHDHLLDARTEKKAESIARDVKESTGKRAVALELIALQDPGKHRELFLEYLSPREPLPLQLAALRSLSSIPGVEISLTLIEKWNSITPELQDAAIATFLHEPRRIALLLEALEKKTVPLSSVSWPRRVRLMADSEPTIRDKARALFTQKNNEQSTNKMSGILSIDGEAERGQLVYQRNCSLCHQIRGKMGLEIGPDLGTVHNWSAEAILDNIMNPNQSISSGFDLCSVQLSNGETVQGIIASETPVAITLRNNGSVDKTITRREIKSLKALNMSIMPADFAEKLTEREMADLLAFLKMNK